MKIIKIRAGMCPEYEILVTDAPVEVIEKQLRINCIREENDIYIKEPYDYAIKKGYTVDFIEDDYFDDDNVDHFLDWYDYYSDSYEGDEVDYEDYK